MEQLVIQINAKSGLTEPRRSFLEINILSNSVLPISFEEGRGFDANTVGLGLGIFWGSLLMFLGVIAMVTGLGAGLVEALSHIHVGYGPTVFGIFMGGISGMVYGFIFGAIIFRAYNVIFARG
ncbi:MAG TPA: hypothetical protein ACFYD2_09260 [Candidatus Avalokitesvara rifleensis]|uniref:hypothetical protein n=1 Tax=Candidatus Avalokitesvara rifleensis TaxID=3367620 RepID=UPI00271310AF|nr:hypothetical protein [Candidatus Brocadiales bacterium]